MGPGEPPRLSGPVNTVNTTKTKVVIFSKKKVRQNQSFKIKGQHIEIIDSYCYLGMLLNYNGNFCTARKKITEQAHKALFAVYRKIRNISIPVDLQLKLGFVDYSPVYIRQKRRDLDQIATEGFLGSS